MGHEKEILSFVRSLTVQDYAKRCYKRGQERFDEDSLRSAFLELIGQAQTAKIASLDPRIQHTLRTLQNKLGLTLKLSDLPPVPANPDSKKLTRLVLVASKVTLQKLVEVQGITNYLNLDKVEDIVKTPKARLYWLWMQAGECYRGKSVDDATALFAPYERGATVKEGLFLHLYYPETLRNCYMDFAGSRYEDGDAPYLHRWKDRPWLGAYYPGSALPDYGSASCLR